MIDRKTLLKYCDGDQELADKFLEMFSSEAREIILSMQHHLAENQWEELSISAHSIKSHLKYIGAEEAAAIANRIEQNANLGNTTMLRDLHSRLAGQVDQILSSI